jgi:hypothetical protein
VSVLWRSSGKDCCWDVGAPGWPKAYRDLGWKLALKFSAFEAQVGGGFGWLPKAPPRSSTSFPGFPSVSLGPVSSSGLPATGGQPPPTRYPAFLGFPSDACRFKFFGTHVVPRRFLRTGRSRESPWETWSGRGDSNARPSPWQGDALPLSYARIRGYAAAAACGEARLMAEGGGGCKRDCAGRRDYLWRGRCRAGNLASLAMATPAVRYALSFG